MYVGDLIQFKGMEFKQTKWEIWHMAPEIYLTFYRRLSYDILIKRCKIKKKNFNPTLNISFCVLTKKRSGSLLIS